MSAERVAAAIATALHLDAHVEAHDGGEGLYAFVVQAEGGTRLAVGAALLVDVEDILSSWDIDFAVAGPARLN